MFQSTKKSKSKTVYSKISFVDVENSFNLHNTILVSILYSKEYTVHISNRIYNQMAVYIK